MSDYHALSGAYALDALDDVERAGFERHLAECAECRAEVAGLRETAALLAETTATEPPAELRDAVLRRIAAVRPLPPETPAPAGASHAGATAAHRWRRRSSALLAAAAAVVAIAAGVLTWQQPWSDEGPTRLSAIEAVLDAPDASSTSMDLAGGAKATVTHSDRLHEAVIVTRDMPAPPAGKVYQLWLQQPGRGMVSAGLMPVRADQRVLLRGDAATAKAAGITVEPEGGSAKPTSDPIALFAFGDSA